MSDGLAAGLAFHAVGSLVSGGYVFRDPVVYFPGSGRSVIPDRRLFALIVDVNMQRWVTFVPYPGILADLGAVHG